MNARLTCISILCFTSLSSASLRADVIVVDAGGGGDHTTLTDAVAAASDGDLLLVRSGTYAGFSIDGKALVVEADQGANVTVNGGSSIANLPGNRSVSLRGLTFTGASAGPPLQTTTLLIDQCAGAVFVQDCDLTQPNFTFGPGPSLAQGSAARVTDSGEVSFTDSTLDAGVHSPQFSTSPGVISSSSSLHLYGCTVRGGTGMTVSQIGTGGGESGIELEGGSLFASGSTLIGGHGGAGLTRGGCSDGAVGGAALFLGTGNPTVTLLDTSLEGGQGGAAGGLFGGVCSPGPQGPATIIDSGSLTELVGLTHRQLTLESPRREGQLSNALFEGQAGDFVYRLLSPGPNALFLPDVNGTLFLRSPVILIPQGTLDAQGERTVSTPVTDFGLDHFTIWEQGLFISVLENDFVLSNAQLVTLLDPAF